MSNPLINRLLVGTLLTVWISSLFANNVWGGYGGSPAPGDPSCVISSTTSKNQSLKLTGTVSLAVTSNLGTQSPQDGDVVVRLQEKNGAPQFFRLHLFTPMDGLSNAERLCRILNPSDTNDPAVQVAVEEFLQKIRLAFQLVAGSQFVILGTFDSTTGTWDTSQAIYSVEPEAAIKVIPNSTNNVPGGAPFLPGVSPNIPPGDHAGSIADVTIYAMW